MKIAIIKEGKVPSDKRVALTPNQCAQLVKKYAFLEIVVQKSELRCFKDEEYDAAGIPLVETVDDCDILLGIKEVPIEQLIPEKTYLFFSHTIKKQAYNRKLLQAILQKKIRMVDYETLTDPDGQRIIAFGRWAGLVGAYNGIRTYNQRYQRSNMKPAHQCFDLEEMKAEWPKAHLPVVKIVVTGGGRVAKGAMEVLDGMGIRKVPPQDFLEKYFAGPVYTQLDPQDYHQAKDGSPFHLQDFFQNPQKYASTFGRFITVADMLVAAAYWDPKAPVLFTREDMALDGFRIKVIADITCDIEGSIPSTVRASTIDAPIYDYNPFTGKEEPAFSSPQNITVMAVDNLPNELPRDASESFGQQLIENVLPDLLLEDKHETISRACIAQNGKLTPRFKYLQDFADGK